MAATKTEHLYRNNPSKILSTCFRPIKNNILLGMNNSMACVTCEISEPTYISYKDKILKKIKNEVDIYLHKIKGLGKFIQIDETAICTGNVISHPTSTHEKFPGTSWLVGGIDEATGDVFLQIVPDRIVPTMLEPFKNFVVEGTTIITDG